MRTLRCRLHRICVGVTVRSVPRLITEGISLRGRAYIAISAVMAVASGKHDAIPHVSMYATVRRLTLSPSPLSHAAELKQLSRFQRMATPKSLPAGFLEDR